MKQAVRIGRNVCQISFRPYRRFRLGTSGFSDLTYAASALIWPPENIDAKAGMLFRPLRIISST